MRFRYETTAERRKRLSEWRPHFCLLPRFVGGTCYWLETIQKRRHYSSYFGGDWTEYRPK